MVEEKKIEIEITYKGPASEKYTPTFKKEDFFRAKNVFGVSGVELKDSSFEESQITFSGIYKKRTDVDSLIPKLQSVFELE
ncbi:MAG: hypothetical protein V1718_02580 [archaeon]